MATGMFKDAKESSSLSNRIIFLTDMEVCTDDGKEFEKFVEKNSNNSIFATIVGVGLDLGNDVIEKVSKTNGCNYCNVRTSENFWEIMNKEFGYLVVSHFCYISNRNFTPSKEMIGRKKIQCFFSSHSSTYPFFRPPWPSM